eukprot:7254234-Pyramimonas_sp.AAC.1
MRAGPFTCRLDHAGRKRSQTHNLRGRPGRRAGFSTATPRPEPPEGGAFAPSRSDCGDVSGGARVRLLGLLCVQAGEIGDVSSDA